MRLHFALLSSAIALVALVLVAPSVQVEAAASLYLQQRCEPDGTVSLAFIWEGNDPQSRQQWVDISQTGGWQPGAFTGAGPLAGNVSSYVWPGWRPGTTYYVRVNQQLANGEWDPSIAYRLEVQTCGGGASQSMPTTPPASQPQPAPQQQIQTQQQSSSGATQIASITSPVGRGKMATATARTQPNASCTITYTPPSGSTATAVGLDPKAADPTGIAIWTWQISGNTNTGDGSVGVTCAGQTATAKIIIIQG